MRSVHGALLVIVFLPTLTAPTFAHPGDQGATGLLSGSLHPLLGWDHLLAIIAVGLWAVRQPLSRAVAITAVWVLAMATGARVAEKPLRVAGAGVAASGVWLLVGA